MLEIPSRTTRIMVPVPARMCRMILSRFHSPLRGKIPQHQVHRNVRLQCLTVPVTSHRKDTLALMGRIELAYQRGHTPTHYGRLVKSQKDHHRMDAHLLGPGGAQIAPQGQRRFGSHASTWKANQMGCSTTELYSLSFVYMRRGR